MLKTVTCSFCNKPYMYDPQNRLGESPFCPHEPVKISGRDKIFSTYTPLPLPTRGGHPRFYGLVSEIIDLHDRKNTDYASGTKEGPLGNFERVSVIMKLYPGFDWDSPFGVACVYMLKQIDAAFTLRSQKRESVTGENIAARLKDVSVYSLIEQILVEEEVKNG